MTQKLPQPHTETEQTDLADCVLRRIESECIKPKPRWRFLFSEYTLWLLWLLSVLAGALAIAVMLYVSMHASYALYEATHETFWEFLMEAAPLLWLFVFFLMAAVAYFNLRHTKKGYRYPVWQILLSSLLLSIIGGGILHNVGAGYVTDSFMHKKLPMYASFEALERQWWQHPEAGMLVGRITVVIPEHDYVAFSDINNKSWRLQTVELSSNERNLLSTGKLVRVLGVRSASSTELFHGCGVFPWMYDKNSKIADIRRERSEFVHKLTLLKQKVAERFATSSSQATTSVALATRQLLPIPLCATMPLVKKMP